MAVQSKAQKGHSCQGQCGGIYESIGCNSGSAGHPGSIDRNAYIQPAVPRRRTRSAASTSSLCCLPKVTKTAADKLLVDDVCNRSDDDLGPVDLTDRTAPIIGQRQWLRSRRFANRWTQIPRKLTICVRVDGTELD